MADFKEQFEQKLDNLLQSKNDNVVIPRKEKRAQWIAQLRKIENEGPKTSDDYNMKKIFEILRVGKTNCTTSRCSCTKKLLKCNSRCHPGRSCSNI